MDKFMLKHMESDQVKIRRKKLDLLIKLLENCEDEQILITQLRRTYPSYKSFKQAYFISVRWNKERTAKIPEVSGFYASKATYINKLAELYKKYEKDGSFEKAKQEDKFLLPQASNRDARDIISAYIFDACSYDFDVFSKKYKVSRELFRSAVNRIKEHDPDLYQRYLEAVSGNKTKEIVMPMYYINSIVEGIKTGKTCEDKDFDLIEFYRLIPFKDKRFPEEMRRLTKEYPKLGMFSLNKQEYSANMKKKTGTNHYLCNFADNIYLFTRCFNVEAAETLKEYMDANNVRNVTPIYRESVIRFYDSVDQDNLEKMTGSKLELTVEEVFDIFEEMDERGFGGHYYQEVFDAMKAKKIRSKQLASAYKLLLVNQENK